MSAKRRKYTAKERVQAGDLYIYQGKSMEEVAAQTGIPIGTLLNWSSRYGWVAESESQEENNNQSFGQTVFYLMRTIQRITRRLFESTLAASGDEDEFFVMPDEHLELRLSRLTAALDRIMPMGNLLQNKHRIDFAREIKQHAFDCAEQKTFSHEQVMTAFLIIEHYLTSLDLAKRAKLGEDA